MPRQDSLTDQMRDVTQQAIALQCYDAVDWLLDNFFSGNRDPRTQTLVDIYEDFKQGKE